MFAVKADPARQRLNCKITGAITEEELKNAADLIKGEATKLSPGWAAAVDLRGMGAVSPAQMAALGQAQKAILETGARKMGTLLRDPKLEMQLSRAGGKAGVNDMTQRFVNEAEWERFLAS